MPDATPSQLEALANPSAWKVYDTLKRATRLVTASDLTRQTRLPRSTVRDAIFRLKETKLIREPVPQYYRMVSVQVPVTLSAAWRKKLLLAKVKAIEKGMTTETAVLRGALELDLATANELKKAISAVIAEFAAKPVSEEAMHVEFAAFLTPRRRRTRNKKRG